MGAVWKTVVAFLVVMVIAAAGISITAGNIAVTAAGAYLEEVCDVIRESNYNEVVMEACVREAESYGYTLSLSRYGSNTGVKRYVWAVLTYPYDLPLLGVHSQKTKQKII